MTLSMWSSKMLESIHHSTPTTTFSTNTETPPKRISSLAAIIFCIHVTLLGSKEKEHYRTDSWYPACRHFWKGSHAYRKKKLLGAAERRSQSSSFLRRSYKKSHSIRATSQRIRFLSLLSVVAKSAYLAFGRSVPSSIIRTLLLSPQCRLRSAF